MEIPFDQGASSEGTTKVDMELGIALRDLFDTTTSGMIAMYLF